MIVSLCWVSEMKLGNLMVMSIFSGAMEICLRLTTTLKMIQSISCSYHKGMYKSGLRHGWGVVTSPDHDILALTGDWHQGWLEDKVRLVTKTTTVFEGWCHQSCFHGPIRKIEMKKFRMFKQQGKDNMSIISLTI